MSLKRFLLRLVGQTEDMRLPKGKDTSEYVGTIRIHVRVSKKNEIIFHSNFWGFGIKSPRFMGEEHVIQQIFALYDILEIRSKTHTKDRFTSKITKR